MSQNCIDSFSAIVNFLINIFWLCWCIFQSLQCRCTTSADPCGCVPCQWRNTTSPNCAAALSRARAARSTWARRRQTPAPASESGQGHLQGHSAVMWPHEVVNEKSCDLGPRSVDHAAEFWLAGHLVVMWSIIGHVTPLYNKLLALLVRARLRGEMPVWIPL